MVGVTIEPAATGAGGAMRRTFVVTFLRDEIVAVAYAGISELERGVVGGDFRLLSGFIVGQRLRDKIRSDYDLVEEIPFSTIHERAGIDAVEIVVERIIHLILCHFPFLSLCSETFRHRLVHRVIVHIAHHEHLDARVLLEQAILYGACLPATALTIE